MGLAIAPSTTTQDAASGVAAANLLAMYSKPNNQMQRTRRCQDGASPLI